MLKKIAMALVATTMLAAAVASPALARQNNGATYNGYPLSDWYTTDSW